MNVLVRLALGISLSLLVIQLQRVDSFGDDVDAQTIYTTEAFYTPYHLGRIAGHFNQSNYDRIEVMAALSGYADLPRWMSYFHRAQSEWGYFYGSPSAEDDGDIDLDIILVDRFTFNTTKDRLKYRILSRENAYKYEAQIKLFNLDLEDFIRKNVSATVLEIFRSKLWQTDQVYMTKMARPIEVGGRFPLDPREKEGVVVRIGSTANFTEELLRLESEAGQIRNRSPCPKRYKASSVEYVFREKKLHVDWCRFMLRTEEAAATKP